MSNNKLYMHIRLHYIKFNKTSKQSFIEKENNHFNLSISRFNFSITFKSMTTSTKLSYLFIFITKAQIARSIVFLIDFSITSMNSTAFKLSRRQFSIISRSTSIILKFSHHSIIIIKASMICLFVSSSNSSRISILSYISSKIYIIMNDLFVSRYDLISKIRITCLISRADITWLSLFANAIDIAQCVMRQVFVSYNRCFSFK